VIEARRWGSSILGVVGAAAVTTVLGRAALWWLGIELAVGWVAVVALLLFAALEVRVRREAQRRRAPAVALMEALLDALEGVTVGWRAGLPTLRTGGVRVRFEMDGGALRVGVSVAEAPGVYLWAARRGEPRIDAWAQRIEARGSERVPGAPASLWVLSDDAGVAKAFVASRAPLLATLCESQAAVLALGDEVRWTADLVDVDAARVVAVIEAIGEMHG